MPERILVIPSSPEETEQAPRRRWLGKKKVPTRATRSEREQLRNAGK